MSRPGAVATEGLGAGTRAPMEFPDPDPVGDAEAPPSLFGGDHYILLAQAGGVPPGGPAPAPPPARDYETTVPIDREVYGSLGDLLQQQDIDAALARLTSKSTGLSLDKVSAFELVVMVAIETLAANPEKAQQVGSLIATMVILGNYPRDEKAKIMRTLASVFNDGSSPDIQKGVVLGIFDAVRQSDKADGFYAGIAAVGLLGDAESSMLHEYIVTYADLHAAKNSAISQDGPIGEEFLKAVQRYSSAYPLKMYPLIAKMRDAWFANPAHGVTWKALMAVSGQDAECEYEVAKPDGTKETRRMTLRAAVESLFKESYGKLDLEGKGKIAQAVVRQIGPEVAPLHVDLLDSLIIDGAQQEADRAVIRAKFLEALVGLNPDVAQERVVVRSHFKLMKFDDSRSTSIREGTQKQDLHHRAVKYLVDDNAAHLRHPAHAFLLDRRPFTNDAEGNPLSPIHAFGVPLLEEGAVEAVRDQAVRDKKGDLIVAQCNHTVDELYREHRKINGLVQLSVAGLPARTFMDFDSDDQPLERDVHGVALRLDFLTAELGDEGTRFLYGGEFQRANGFLEGAARLGAGWDLLDNRLFLKIPVGVGYFRLEGTEDDRREVTFDGNDGPVALRSNAFKMEGALLTVSPEISLLFHRWQLGEGRTFALLGQVGFDASAYFGWLSDKSGRRSLDPEDTTGTATSAENVTLTGRAGRLDRDGEFHAGYSYDVNAGLLFEYQWQ